MVKKFVTIVMVLGILGGILAGCSKSEDTGAATTPPAAGGETAGAPAGGAAPAAPATGG